MPSKIKAWLKAKLGFRGPVPYKTLTEEEVEVEPVVTYNCDYCAYRSPTQKGLRCHRITVHRIGVGSYQPLPENHQVGLKRCTAVAVWTTSLVISVTAWIPSSVLEALHFSGCLDQMFGHISQCLDTINCTTLWWLLGIQVYSNHSLPGQHQLCLKRYTSAAVL
ncbi:hypothetical protein TNCT_575261 [Trichonephila clavata]|uniref:Uncharacterized protein n=1 Tax=Trichonephila clavata TaxID=2740835 RepID=A0A8X6HRP6_TRICU|nr:hypothetical protein TNCT_575261 [Trichonephila clavata]